MLTQYYPPEVGAPQTRLALLVKQLVERGHQVTVLTAMPNYPQGKIHPGYGGFLKFESTGGVRIIRSFIYPSQKASFIFRMANYFSFVLSSALAGSFFLRKSDFLMVESPPLFLGLSAWWLTRLKRARLIFNVADPWPDKLVDMGVLKQASKLYQVSSSLATWFYRQSWLVSYQERGISGHIKPRAPAASIYFLSNGADTTQFSPANYDAGRRAELAGGAQFLAVFAGMYNLQQGLNYVLDVAELLKDNLDIRFALVGDGPLKQVLVADAVQRNLTNVTFLSALPSKEISQILATADLSLAPIKLALPSVVPVKMYEGLASGRPVVLMAALEGEAAKIIRENNCGIAVEPGDVEGMAAAIRRLCQDADLSREMGENGRRTAIEKFDRTVIADRFIDYLEENLSG